MVTVTIAIQTPNTISIVEKILPVSESVFLSPPSFEVLKVVVADVVSITVDAVVTKSVVVVISHSSSKSLIVPGTVQLNFAKSRRNE